jgi:chorismate mutase
MSPSSVTNSKLSKLRDELAELNAKLFVLFTERATVVEQIQVEKKAPTAFDATRELSFFDQQRSSLLKLSEYELLAFSLLMEGHAGAPGKYPAWSAGVHLLEAPSHKWQQINPVLLRVLHPERFAMLRMKPDFAFLQSI